jgi:hypothetical protein
MSEEDKNEAWQNIVLPDIDKVTLECFMNKTRYNKYVTKTDPKRSAEIQQYLADIKKYQGKIKDITGSLLQDPNMPVTNEVNEAFDFYIKTLIKHFQASEFEKKESFSHYNCDNNEEDTLFGQMDDDNNDLQPSPKMSSFWSTEYVIKKR